MMSKTFYLVAGETSGDKIGAHLAAILKKQYLGCQIFGMGGQAMRQAGVTLDFDISHFAMFGFKDIILKLRSAFLLRYHLLEKIASSRSDVVILIDYPGLNLSLLRTLRQKGCRVIYYVCPKVWASREYRVKKLQQSSATLWSIFPFETSYFRNFNLHPHFLGHPLLETIHSKTNPGSPIKKIVLMPGSRESEIKKHAPIMIDVVKVLKTHYTLEFSIAMANSRHNELLCRVFSPLIAQGDVYIKPGNIAEEDSDYAIAASGTVTLELAKRMIPMCVIYKLDRFSYWLAKKIVKVPFISLCNLIANKTVVPEFIQKQACAKSIVEEFQRVFEDSDYREMMLANMQEVVKTMGHFNEQRLVKTLDSVLDDFSSTESV